MLAKIRLFVWIARPANYLNVCLYISIELHCVFMLFSVITAMDVRLGLSNWSFFNAYLQSGGCKFKYKLVVSYLSTVMSYLVLHLFAKVSCLIINKSMAITYFNNCKSTRKDEDAFLFLQKVLSSVKPHFYSLFLLTNIITCSSRCLFCSLVLLLLLLLLFFQG